jgi:sarcosine oxidase
MVTAAPPTIAKTGRQSGFEMMTQDSTFDVIIVGLGAMGSATAYHLAKRGARLLGLDRFTPPHTLGSSHGKTRVIREAYFEDPCYVPIVQRAYELWLGLERESGAKLFSQTGGLMIGKPDSVVVSGAVRSAQQHRLAYQSLSRAEVERLFPALHLAEGMVAAFEPRAGVLFPERCVEAHLKLAKFYGAELHCDEPVISWSADGQGVRLKTARGEYRAARAVFTGGAWTTKLLSELSLPLQCERQTVFWFEPRKNPQQFASGNLPVFIMEFAKGRFFYGIPDFGDGFKVARHHEGEMIDPDAVNREVSRSEIDSMRSLLRVFLPDAEGFLRATSVCIYTNAPDAHFVIDRHPHHPQIILASPCSGHGFKFSSAVGEILAEMATDRPAPLDVGLFGLKRFSKK